MSMKIRSKKFHSYGPELGPTLFDRRVVEQGGSLTGMTHFMLANEDRTLGVILLSNADSMLPNETLAALITGIFDYFESVYSRY